MTTTTCPAYWTELNGGVCPQAGQNKLGLPLGAHTCSVERGHGGTHCRCACGSMHKKPAELLHVERVGGASISVDESGHGKVMVGPTDITRCVGGGVVQFQAGQATTLKVVMPMVTLVARGDVELDEETAGALEALGWASPQDLLYLRRDLAEALGVTDTVLPDLPTLIRRAREINDALDEELDK